MRTVSFGAKIVGGFAGTVLLTVILGGVTTWALRAVVAAKDRTLTVNAQNLIDGERLQAAMERKGGGFRSVLLQRQEHFLDLMREARAEFAATLGQLRARADSAEARQQLEQIERLETEHQAVAERVVAQRRTEADLAVITRTFDQEALPKATELRRVAT